MSKFQNAQTGAKCYSKFLNEVMRRVSIEKGTRRLADSMVIYGHYLVDYLILWTILSDAIKTYVNPLSLFWPFFGVRLVAAVLFIAVKHPVFFLLDKLTIFIQMLMLSASPLYCSVANVAVELVMSGVWALTKEQRKVHSDSSLGLGKIFVKQTMLYLLLLVSSVYTELKWVTQRECVVGIVISFFLALDSSQFYYHKRVKTLFIKFDLILLALYFLLTLKSFLSIAYPSFILCSFVLFVAVFVEFFLIKKQFSDLLKVPLTDVDTHNQEELAEHFVSVKLLLESNNREMFDAFTHKVIAEAKHTMKNYPIKPESQRNRAYKEDLLNTYIIQNLRNHARNSPFILDLLVFLYSPDPRIFISFDLNLWKHRREYERILATQAERTMLQEFEFQKQKKETHGLLSKCVNLRKQFYRQLAQEKIKQEKTLQVGLQLMRILRQYMGSNQTRLKKSPQTILLFNKFSSQCLSPYFAFKIPVEGALQIQETEKDPSLLVGVRFQRYMRPLSMNNQLKQIGSFTQKKVKKLTIENTFGSQFGHYIEKIIEDESQKRQAFKDIEKVLELVCLRSSLGFDVVCQCSISSGHYMWDYCLKLDLKPLYFDKAIIIVDSTGKVLGLSDLTRHFGFQAEHSGATIEKHVLEELIQKQVYTTKKGELITKKGIKSDIEAYRVAVLTQVKPDHLSKKVMVLELRFLADRVEKSVQAQKPVPFAFNFNWRGQIVNFETANLLPSQESQVKRKTDVMYDENITEMRYFKEQIDYKSNFQEERDCLSLPVQVEENFPDIEEEQFFGMIERKKGSTALSLKVVYILIILLILLSLGILFFLFFQFYVDSKNNSDDLQVMLKLQQKMHLLIRMTVLPVVGSMNLDIDPIAIIEEAIKTSSDLSTTIFGISPNIMSGELGQLYQSQINEFNAQINQYLLNPTPDKRQTIFAAYSKVGNTFGKFRTEKLAEWMEKITAFQQKGPICIIVPTILALALLFLLSLIHYRLKFSKLDIMSVMKSIHEDDLKQQQQQLECFSAKELENEDSRGYQGPCQQQEQHQSSSKKVVQSLPSIGSQFIHLLWLILFAIVLAFFYSSIIGFNRTSCNYFQFADKMSAVFTMQEAIWIRLHQTPFSPFMYNLFTGIRIQNQNMTFVAYRELIQDPQVNISHFMQGFWENNTFCSSVAYQDCQTIIGPSTKEGASIVFNQLSLYFQELRNYALKKKSLSSHPNYKTLVRMYYYYLYSMLLKNFNVISEDFALYSSRYWTKIVLLLGFGVLLTLLLGGFILYYRRVWEEHEMHEDLLLTIPFQRLKKITNFHRFYQQNYKNQL